MSTADEPSPSGVDKGMFATWMTLFGALARQEGWPLHEVRELTNTVFDYWEENGYPPPKRREERGS